VPAGTPVLAQSGQLRLPAVKADPPQAAAAAAADVAGPEDRCPPGRVPRVGDPEVGDVAVRPEGDTAPRPTVRGVPPALAAIAAATTAMHRTAAPATTVIRRLALAVLARSATLCT
jgi:hypothetical protein